MLFRNTNNPTDTKIYVGDPETMEIPKGYVEAQMIYHVSACEEKDADYEAFGGVFYKFTSDAGREAFLSQGIVTKSNDSNAVTCPDCLCALKLSRFVVEFEAPPIVPPKKKTPKKKKPKTVEDDPLSSAVLDPDKS